MAEKWKNLHKRVLVYLLALLLTVPVICPPAMASSVVASGNCGPSGYEKYVTWTLTEDGVLTISGDNSANGDPWSDYGSKIKEVIIESGVTELNGYAFGASSYGAPSLYGNLTKVLLEEGLKRINRPGIGYARGFYRVPVETVFIPSSIEYIEYDAFGENSQLRDVYYAGSEDGWSKIGGASGQQFWDASVYPTIHYNSRYVRYMDNGGDNAPFFQGFELGTTTGLLLTDQVPTRENYVFTEWNTEPDGSGTSYLPGKRYQFDDSTVLYAQWFGDGPTADVASGKVVPGTKVRLSCPTKGETIYYTTDGSNPTTRSTVYTDPITVDGTMALKTMAVWGGHASRVNTYRYEVYGTGEPLIYAGKARTVAGNRAVVPVYMVNNPGVASLRVSVAYDDTAMTLLSAEDAGLLSGTNYYTDDLAQDPFYLYWDNYAATQNNMGSGLIATLTFLVYEGTQPGYYPVTVSLSQGDALDFNGSTVPFTPVSAQIHVDAAYLGDIDGNDWLEAADGMRLLRWLANWNGYEQGTDLMAADVNRDAQVDVLDGAILLRHLAKWSGYKILPYANADKRMHTMRNTAYEKPTITVSSGTAMAGDTIDVTIDVYENPGIAMMRLYVNYDPEVLTLVGVKDGRMLGSAMHGTLDNLSNCPYTLFWNNATANRNYTANGTVATLTFQVSRSIGQACDVPVSLSYHAEEHDILNNDLEPVDFDLLPGVIAVTPLVGATAWGDLSYTFDRAAKTVTVYGPLQNGAIVCCAQYDTRGRMLRADRMTIGEAMKISQDAGMFKLFLLDQSMRPLSAAVSEHC